MLESFRRRSEDEQGFTLIELMVVVLIIAILIAIAIPTFLGAQDRARDRAAQSDLRNAYTAAKSIASDFEGNWQTVDTCVDANASTLFAAALGTENASLTYGAGTTTSETVIAVDVSNDAATPGGCEQILLQRLSTSGKNYCLAGHQNGRTFRDRNDTGGSFTYATCDAPDGW